MDISNNDVLSNNINFVSNSNTVASILNKRNQSITFSDKVCNNQIIHTNNNYFVGNEDSFFVSNKCNIDYIEVFLSFFVAYNYITFCIFFYIFNEIPRGNNNQYHFHTALNPLSSLFCPSRKLNNIYFGNSYPGNFNLVYANLQGMLENCHLDEFMNEVSKSNNIHSYAIVETWLRKGVNSNKSIEINGFKVLRSDRVGKKDDRNKGGGVALYIRNGVNSKILLRSSDNNYNIDNAEFIFVEVSSKVFRMCVVLVYRTSKCNVSDTIKLFNLIIENSAIYSDVLIVGDFNINILRDISPLKALNDYFSIINHFCPTHRWPNADASLIDIVLSKNPERINCFAHYGLLPSTHHDILCISYKTKKLNQNKPVTFSYRNYKKINKEALIQSARSIDWSNFLNSTDIDAKVEIFNNNYFQIFNENVPLTKVWLKYNSKP